MKKRIAIFASGGGSNAQKIAEYFSNHPTVEVALIVSNKADAGALKIAESMGIDTYVIPSKKEYLETQSLLQELYIYQIDFIALAGYLWLIPTYLVDAFDRRIINIHPALLPKYGGKGMYGMRVHEAVVANKENETGITIHYVDNVYDHGEHILQAKVVVEPNDTAQTVQKKVLALEHEHFPKVIEQLLNE